VYDIRYEKYNMVGFYTQFPKVLCVSVTGS